MHNQLLHFLARGNRLPSHWGFPKLRHENVTEAHPLRKTLMFHQDSEGLSQLVRWYFSILRSNPSLEFFPSSREYYEPSLAILPQVDVAGAIPDPRSGYLKLDWCPYDEDLSAVVERMGDLLVFHHQGKSQNLNAKQGNYGWEIDWPAPLGLQLGFDTLAEGTTTMIFRPDGFDVTSLLARLVDRHMEDLEKADLAELYASVPFEWFRLALFWKALLIIEHE